MVHGVSASGLAARPYFHRYSEDAIDLCDVFSSFSPQGKATLHEISKVMGLPHTVAVGGHFPVSNLIFNHHTRSFCECRFKFRETARRQPEIRILFGCGGQKKQGPPATCRAACHSPSVCAPSRPASSRPASQPKPTRYPLAANGCMRSSMMAFGLPAQLFTGSLWRAARLGHPKWGA